MNWIGWSSSAQRLYGSQMRAVRIQARYQPLLQAIPAFGQVAILAVGGYLALEHEITIGTFLAFSTYVAQMVAPARMLAGVLTVAQQARAGVERIFQLIDLPPAIADSPDAVDAGRLAGAVDFDGVSFAYPDGPPVLEGFDLHLAPGERVALVGPSGSGKSTVALMVGRFHDPVEGCVRVDGRDVRGADPPFPAPPVGVRIRGDLPLLRIGASQHRLRPARRRPGRD